jgi:GcrA cell cycle regulator
MAFDWNPENVERLKRLWDSGLSGTQVAYVIGGGVSRSAVIGAVHRRGLSGRKKPERSRGNGKGRGRAEKVGVTVAAAATEAPVRPSMPIIVVPPIPVSNTALKGPLAILGLKPGVCKFGIGDVGDPEFSFCGHDTGDPAFSYCGYHCGIVYQPVGNAAARRGVWR